MNPYKLAALRLAALSRADRVRVLRRLPRNQRILIRHHVDGLRRFEALGIPFRYLLTRLLTSVEKATLLRYPADTVSESRQHAGTMMLDGLEAGRVEPALKELPVPLRASLLRSRAWRWRRDYLNRCDVSERRALLTHLRRVRIMSDDAREALVNTLLSHMQRERHAQV